jgi:hypothetical protein
VLLGYAWLEREEQLVRFFVFYAVLTSVALIGTPLEYFRLFDTPALGVVAMPDGYIRHLPGLQIRVLSGLYRTPDIMAWHAATLTAIGAIMAVRARVVARAWPWVGVAAWGFLCCLISGRRKAIYMVAVFGLAFLWRYIRRMNTTQVALVIALGLALGMIVREVASREDSAVYTQGARTTFEEVISDSKAAYSVRSSSNRLGADSGAATQGVRHVSGRESDFGWQEGGLGKLAAELGLPGLLVAALLAWALIRMMLRITTVPDIPGTSQVLRAGLFALVIANIGNFSRPRRRTRSRADAHDGVLRRMPVRNGGAGRATARAQSAKGGAQERITGSPAPSACPLRSDMKILHVVPTYLPARRYGGPIVAVHGLCKALVARGHQVHVMTTNVDGDSASDVPVDRVVDVDGVAVRYFPSQLTRLYWSPEMGRALRHVRDYDVVHVHAVYLWPGVAAARAARSAKVPYVISPRGMLVPELIRQKSRAMKRSGCGSWSAAGSRAHRRFTSRRSSNGRTRNASVCRCQVRSSFRTAWTFLRGPTFRAKTARSSSSAA